MPTRRKTRNVKSSRPKPKAPRGSEGAALLEEERQEKLDLFVKDFDMEVASRRKKMLEYGEDIIKQIHALYSLEIMKLPKDVRNMCIGDLMKDGSSGLKSGLEPDTESLVDQFTSSLDSRINATVKKTRAAMPMETIAETGEGQTGRKTSKKRGRCRPVPNEIQSTSTRPNRFVKHSSLRNQVTEPHATPFEPATTSSRSRRTLRRVQETPSVKGGPGIAGWETPLVTPKFDPRLPKTPAEGRRKAKPGEAISFVSMCVPVSVTGSPLAVDQPRSPTEKLLAMPAGSKVIQLPITRGINLEEAKSVFGELNEKSMENLVNLRENLNKILQG